MYSPINPGQSRSIALDESRIEQYPTSVGAVRPFSSRITREVSRAYTYDYMLLARHNITSTPQVLVRYQTRGGKKEYLYLSSSIFLYLLFLGLFPGQRASLDRVRSAPLQIIRGYLLVRGASRSAVYP